MAILFFYSKTLPATRCCPKHKIRNEVIVSYEDMKVYVLTFGDLRHGSEVVGVYASHKAAVDSLQQHVDRHFKVYGGYHCALQCSSANYWHRDDGVYAFVREWQVSS